MLHSRLLARHVGKRIEHSKMIAIQANNNESTVCRNAASKIEYISQRRNSLIHENCTVFGLRERDSKVKFQWNGRQARTSSTRVFSNLVKVRCLLSGACNTIFRSGDKCLGNSLVFLQQKRLAGPRRRHGGFLSYSLLSSSDCLFCSSSLLASSSLSFLLLLLSCLLWRRVRLPWRAQLSRRHLGAPNAVGWRRFVESGVVVVSDPGLDNTMVKLQWASNAV